MKQHFFCRGVANTPTIPIKDLDHNAKAWGEGTVELLVLGPEEVWPLNLDFLLTLTL